MFKKADMEAYQSIKAPSELRQKVMMADKNRISFSYYKLQAVPACLAMVICLSMMWNWNRSYVTIQDEMTSIQNGVQTATFASLNSRKISQNSISLKLDSNHKRKVVVSEGSLQYVDSKNGKLVAGDSTLWVEANAEVFWDLDPQVDENYELKVMGWGKDETFLLIYDQVEENWKIKKQ